MNILKKLTTIMVVGAIFAATQNVYAILLTIDVPENISELRFTHMVVYLRFPTTVQEVSQIFSLVEMTQ
jgi:hypothetical protein